MADTAPLLADLAKLKKALRSGALSVQHGDKRVQYRSLSEIRDAIADIEREIEEASGKKRKRVFYLDIGRGY